MAIKMMLCDDGGEAEEVDLPSVKEVCGNCEGEGVTLVESLRGAFTESEFRECFDDEDSREEYFKGGHGAYGQTCETCKGLRVVDAIDWEALGADKRLHERVEAQIKRDRRARREQAAELEFQYAERGYRG